MNLETSRTSLITSAEDLFLKYGIKSVSMDDIARLLGISKKTIYNFIANKKGLVHAVVQSHIEKEQAMVNEIIKSSENALDEMVSIAEHVLDTLKKMKPTLTYDLKKYHPRAWQVIEDVHFNFIQATVATNLKRGINEGYYREDIDANILSKVYLTLSRAISEDDSFAEEGHNLSEVYTSVIHYHLNGIVNSKGRKELKKYLKF